MFYGFTQTHTQSLFMCFVGERRLGVRLRRAQVPESGVYQCDNPYRTLGEHEKSL